MQTLTIGQLVITHLPDPSHDNKEVIVSAVVLVPGPVQSRIRIRDVSANTKEIEVDNSKLSTR